MIENVNRTVVLALSLGGSLSDAFQPPDILFALAVALWLWMPSCARLETRLLRRVHYLLSRKLTPQP